MQVNFNKTPDLLEFQEILLETIFQWNFLAFSWCLCTMYLLSRHAGFKSNLSWWCIFFFSIECSYNLPTNFVLIVLKVFVCISFNTQGTSGSPGGPGKPGPAGKRVSTISSMMAFFLEDKKRTRNSIGILNKWCEVNKKFIDIIWAVWDSAPWFLAW